MTRKEAFELWQIIKAYGEGKTIQEKHIGSSTDAWIDMHEMEELDLNDSYWEYRIKPEEDNWEEVMKQCDESKKHLMPYTIEQNVGENRVEGGVLSISGSVSGKHYRPFKDCDELIETYQKKYKSAVGCDIYFPKLYKSAIWVRHKVLKTEHLITSYGLIKEVNIEVVEVSNMNYSMKELLESWEFLDGSPIGIVE